MSLHRRSLTVAAIAALTLAGLGVNASAEEPGPAVTARGTVQATPAASETEPVARGLIVQTTTSTPSDGALDATDDALGSEASVAADDKLTGKISTIDFDETVTSAVATDVAAQVAKRADVVWAAPNTLRQRQAEPVVTPNDPYFPRQQNLSGSKYSINAPSFWQKTQGSDSVRVAVLDTGILPEEPEFAGQLVPGYDMVDADDPEASTKTYNLAGDNDGRDADPTDPGDWTRKGECYRNSRAYPSSWHGTFVAAQIAAKTDNALGIAGIASGVKIQPVRVLGHCGGWDSDIIAGMTWASGGHVDGVPDQSTAEKAQVVNLSLGYTYSKTSERDQVCQAYAAAAAPARQRGTIFIAAAGNDGSNADLAVPASCSGFVSVGATSGRGFSASYSNIGKTVDLSAPGGDTLVEGSKDAIVSLGNTGTKGPLASKYVRYEGTSMAAPQVSAAAALYYSLGLTSPKEVETALRATTRHFRKKSAAYAYKPVRFGGKTYYLDLNCSGHRWCGDGILDLSRAQVPLAPPTVSGTPVVGEMLTAVPGTWIRTPSQSGSASPVQYLWEADGAFRGAGSSYYVDRSDIGKTITVSVRSLTPGFSSLSATSEPAAVVPTAGWVTMTVQQPSFPNVLFGQLVTATVKVSQDQAGEVPAVDGTVEIRRGSEPAIATGQVVDGTATIDIPVDGWAPGTNALRAAYLGSESTPAGSSPVKFVTFEKGTPSVLVEGPSKIRKGSRPRLHITVGSVVPDHATGRVKVYERQHLVTTVTLPSSGSGTLSLLMPAVNAKSGYYTAEYSGNQFLKARTSAGFRVNTY